MLAALQSGFEAIIGFVGDVISAIFGTATEAGGIAGAWAEIQTLIGIGVGIFLVRVSVGVIKSLVQGY